MPQQYLKDIADIMAGRPVAGEGAGLDGFFDELRRRKRYLEGASVDGPSKPRRRQKRIVARLAD